MRILKKGLIFVLSAYIFLSLGLYFMQEKIIFLPTKLQTDYSYDFSTSFEEIFLDAQDGAQLNALHFKAEKPKGIILYFHGNAGDLSRWGEIASEYTKFDYDVLVMDYRTYGKSTGKLSEVAMLQDAQLFYDYVNEMYSEEKIVVLGRSLGTTFAAYVSSRNSPNKLILETPFYSMEQMAKLRFPYFPVSYFLRYKFPSNEYIQNVKCPVVIFHGTEDSVVPYESGVQLSELVPTPQLSFISIPDGDHNDLLSFKEYSKGISEALQ
ncbi:alpha/beta hydrolase [Ulvibacter antarcticus]|uniref:Serine aminopeptidase S33 domain-containing protein n=1 Tax=Ulvibacter antarcticus TaxID=442714 RepID=A0A3L9YZG0_9FLAO|nr:alpha/beta hydrolase [Ulvibacter antarcticus]RMA64489.1 hypothetical protein BXY75_1365 [Ulvibacter antarcticus]